ncbi:MAG: leucine-rich repeat domain-containing protein [Paludibacteraceae bacterium]|nr:leucine-rich repeat domain-containing protein [Paludibacteraceae bacterium]
MRAYIDGLHYSLDELQFEAVVISPLYRDEDGYISSDGDYEGDITIPSHISQNGIVYSVVAIANGAFRDSYIQSLTMSNSISRIGNKAFFNCNGLTKIKLSTNITFVGYDVFTGTPWLDDQPFGLLYVGKVLYTHIGKITNETNVKIKEGTIAIADYAFVDQEELRSIIIPNSIKHIGSCAFQYCSGLVSINIPNGVTKIEEYTFENCSKLSSIDIPDSVVSIGYNAFNNTLWYHNQPDGGVYINKVLYKWKNKELIDTSLIIQDDIVSISPCAFNDKDICKTVTSIIIPKDVIDISTSAFCGCCNVALIIVDVNNPKYDSRDNCNAIIETASNTLLFGCSNTIIPNSIVNISSYAFEHCADSMQSIFIPKSVENIAARAFAGCSGVTSIIVDQENKMYDSRANSNAIIKSHTNMLILGCQNTVIPSGVCTIGYAAFEKCKQLRTVFIPQTVNKIEDKAFSDCDNLTNIIFLSVDPPKIDGYPFLNKNAFYSENDEAINLYTTSRYDDWCDGTYYTRDNHKRWQKMFSNFQMHDINFIVDEIHYKITGDYVVKVIPNIYGFLDSAYKTLSNIKIPECVIYNGIKFTVNEIDYATFNDCINLVSINMPDTIIKIGNNAFYNCCNLSSVTFSKNLKSIGDFAFSECPKLTSIIIPKNLDNIGICAFDNEQSTDNVITISTDSVG